MAVICIVDAFPTVIEPLPLPLILPQASPQTYLVRSTENDGIGLEDESVVTQDDRLLSVVLDNVTALHTHPYKTCPNASGHQRPIDFIPCTTFVHTSFSVPTSTTKRGPL